jgi:hypothetical protein
VDIDQLKEKLKEQSEQKKRVSRKGSSTKTLVYHEDEFDQQKSHVVGIVDVRKALKRNLVTI